MAGAQVRLADDVRKMIDDIQEAERIAGRPTLSEAKAANWLIRLGYASLAGDEKRTKAGKR